MSLQRPTVCCFAHNHGCGGKVEQSNRARHEGSIAKQSRDTVLHHRLFYVTFEVGIAASVAAKRNS